MQGDDAHSDAAIFARRHVHGPREAHADPQFAREVSSDASDAGSPSALLVGGAYNEPPADDDRCCCRLRLLPAR